MKRKGPLDQLTELIHKRSQGFNMLPILNTAQSLLSMDNRTQIRIPTWAIHQHTWSLYGVHHYIAQTVSCGEYTQTLPFSDIFQIADLCTQLRKRTYSNVRPVVLVLGSSYWSLLGRYFLAAINEKKKPVILIVLVVLYTLTVCS